MAFPILGGGPGEADPVARVVTIVRAAEAYHQACRAEGRAPGVEEVFVCAPDRGVYQAARRKLGMEAKAADLTPVAKKAAPARRRAASGGSRAKKPKGLDPNVAAQQRATAEPFSIAKTYAEGDFMNHKKFGVGRVEAVLQEGAIEVKFEDGSVRKMAHGRA